MLLKEEFKPITAPMKLFTMLSFLPFEWNYVVGSLKVCRSRTKFVISLLLYWWQVVYGLLLLIRFYPPSNSWIPCERVLEKEIFHIITTIAYLSGSTESRAFNCKSKEVAFLFKQLVLFNRMVGKQQNYAVDFKASVG